MYHGITRKLLGKYTCLKVSNSQTTAWMLNYGYASGSLKWYSIDLPQKAFSQTSAGVRGHVWRTVRTFYIIDIL